jgi:hypothetical protein
VEVGKTVGVVDATGRPHATTSAKRGGLTTTMTQQTPPPACARVHIIAPRSSTNSRAFSDAVRILSGIAPCSLAHLLQRGPIAGNELAMEEEAEEALATRVEEQREQFVVAAEEAASDPSQLLDFIEQH